MKKLFYIILLSFGVLACKPTEANYRAAYDRATAGRESATPIENTIYGASRRNFTTALVADSSDTLTQRTMRVRVSEGGGGLQPWLKPYSVAVGGFKMQFNAFSMRERLTDNGFPGAFVVETGEPYFYVLSGSYETQQQAVEAVHTLRADSLPIGLRSPYPFILNTRIK